MLYFFWLLYLNKVLLCFDLPLSIVILVYSYFVQLDSGGKMESGSPTSVQKLHVQATNAVWLRYV
jgi:hypothetical protein